MGSWGEEIINQDQLNKRVAAVGRRTADNELFLCVCVCVLFARVDSSTEPIRRRSPRPLEPGIISQVLPEYKAAIVGQSLVL